MKTLFQTQVHKYTSTIQKYKKSVNIQTFQPGHPQAGGIASTAQSGIYKYHNDTIPRFLQTFHKFKHEIPVSK